MIRRFTREQLDHERSERPDIRGCRSTRLVDHLGCHPVRRANYRRVRWTSDSRGDAEIGNWLRSTASAPLATQRCQEGVVQRTFDAALLCGENVASLDVAVDHPLVVKVQQTLKDLKSVQARERLWEPSKFLDDGREGTVLAVLEDDVESRVCAGVSSVLDDV